MASRFTVANSRSKRDNNLGDGDSAPGVGSGCRDSRHWKTLEIVCRGARLPPFAIPVAVFNLEKHLRSHLNNPRIVSRLYRPESGSPYVTPDGFWKFTWLNALNSSARSFTRTPHESVSVSGTISSRYKVTVRGYPAASAPPSQTGTAKRS